MHRITTILIAIVLCLTCSSVQAQVLTFRQRAASMLGNIVKPDGTNITSAKALRVLRVYWVIRQPTVAIPGPVLPLGPLTDAQATTFTTPQVEQLSQNFVEGRLIDLKQEILNVEARAAAQAAALAKQAEVNTLDLATP